jgi:hypothetical protein
MWTISLQKISLLKMSSKRDAKQESTCGLRKPRAPGCLGPDIARCFVKAATAISYNSR